MAKIQVIDPIDLLQRTHEQYAALIKSELDSAQPNLTRIKAVEECDTILIDTVKDMLTNAEKEIVSHERRQKAQ